MRGKIGTGRILSLTILAAIGLAAPAWSATKDYSGPSGGFWADNANWFPVGEPVPGDTVRLIYGGGGEFVVNFNDFFTYGPTPLNSLTIDAIGGGNVTLVHPSSGIVFPYRMVASTETVGLNGKGAYTQSGGVNGGGTLYVAYNPNSTGAYNLNGGDVSFNDQIISDDTNAQGKFIQTAGTNTALFNLKLGSYSAASNGAYTLGGGSLTTNSFTDAQIVGDQGNGTFTHTAGVNSAGGFLIVGNQPTATGSYTLSGSGSLTVANQEIIGQYGTGTFTQNGGTHTANSYLRLGLFGTGVGTFELNAGSLTVNSLDVVGFQGKGTFKQTGGTHSIGIGGQLQLGANATGNGTYLLNGGTLVQNDANLPEVIGLSGTGVFTQTNGTNNAHGVAIALNGGSHGTYNLQGGTLNTIVVDLLPGGTFFESAGVLNALTFNHSGGEVKGILQNQGTFNYNSGLFSGRLQNFGSINFNADFTAGNGMENNWGITLPPGRNVTLLGTDGLTNNSSITQRGNLTVAGYDSIGQSAPATFNQLGGTHTSLGSLLIGLNAEGSYFLNDGALSTKLSYIGDGNIGTLTQNGGTHTAEFGFVVGHFSNGTYNLNAGTLIANGPERIGNYNIGTFTQFNGTHTLNSDLRLGEESGSSGTYYLFAGGLSVSGSEFVGNKGAGRFRQDGGVNNCAGSLYIGIQTGSSGEYDLSAPGSLSASLEIVGDGAPGVFMHNGGTNQVGNSLWVGFAAGGTGSYTLQTGNLAVADPFGAEYVGYGADGTFLHNGGSNTGNFLLEIAHAPGVNGAYSIQPGATLSASQIMVGFRGNGTFTQGGGNVTASLPVVIASAAGSSGAYTMQGGTLHAEGIILGGDANASGNFTLANGDVVLTNDLTVGYELASHGQFTLFGGNLTVGANEDIGYRGQGAFTQSGGSHTILGKLTTTNFPAVGDGKFDLQAGSLTVHAVQNSGTFHSTGTLSVATTFVNEGAANIGGIQNWAPASTLEANGGKVELESNTGRPASITTPAVANLTVNLAFPGAKIVLRADQDFKELNVISSNPAAQSFDLATPVTPGAFRSLRVYSPNLAAAKASLYAAIANANRAGAPDPTDGIHDSGLSAHPGSAIGIAKLTDLHGDPYLLIRPTRIGDLNLDGQVTISDFIDLASHFNQIGAATWQEGDLNFDNSVTISDFIDLSSNFNASYSGGAAGFSPQAVPEPGTFAGLSAAALLLGVRRRKRSR